MKLTGIDAIAFAKNMYRPSKEYIEECRRNAERIESRVTISDRTDRGFIAHFDEEIKI